MVKDGSKKDIASTHSFLDYAYAVEVVRDFPKLLSIYNKLLPVLYPYSKYTGASEVINSVEDCRLLLELQLDFYERVYESKGKIK